MSDKLALELKETPKPFKMKLSSGGYVKEVYWNDIKNKPFGIITHFDAIKYDGVVPDGAVKTNSVDYFGQELYLVKIGELPTSAEEYIKRLDSIILNVDMDVDVKNNKVSFDDNYAVMMNGLPVVVAINEDNSVVNGYTYPEAGFYVMHSKQTNGFIITVKEITFEEIVTIDEKYLPEEYHKLKSYDIENIERWYNLHHQNNGVYKHLPIVYKEDAGKFLRVNSNGTWVAELIPNITEVEF
ncbi:MAG: hypothetical protein IJ279_04125 [Clostridia bacterium]|nr:hypothetical protein [Clostridia bacterium]